MPDGPAKDEAWEALAEYQDGVPFGAPRLFAGRDFEQASVINLSDSYGRTRIQLKVDPEGAASLSFLDEEGNILFSLPDMAQS